VLVARIILQQNDRKNTNTTKMVKSIPKKLEGEIKFPRIEGQTENVHTKYSLKGLAELNNGFNNGALISAKIVMHLAKE